MGRTQKTVRLGALRSVTVDRLEAFRSVIECGGYAAVAPRDPARQSLLNRQVHALEKLLGARLTRIEHGRVLPTAEGARLLSVVTDLFEGLANVATPTLDTPVDATLAAGDSALHWVVIPSLPALEGRSPAVRLSLTATANAVLEVRQGRAQLAIAPSSEVPDDFHGATLAKLRYGLFVPRGLDPEGGSLNERLERVPLVRVTSDTRVWDAVFAGRTPRVTLECETFPQAARAVATGRYAALLPLMARSELRADVLPVPSSYGPGLALIARVKTLGASAPLAAVFDDLAAALRATIAKLSALEPKARA